MRIIDAFPFFNEVDLLQLRLRTLDPYVDEFVIAEAPITFSGKEKPLYFEASRDKFSAFLPKITHVVLEDLHATTAFERDDEQKNLLTTRLAETICDDDLVLLSDVDEIPNPATFLAAADAAQSGRVAHFAQRLFYYYLNLEEVSGRLPSITGDYPSVSKPQWLGTRMVLGRLLRSSSFSDLRLPHTKENGVRISNGGWHFSYCGSPDPNHTLEDRVSQKLNAWTHQDLVNDKLFRKLSRRLDSKKDLFGRRGPHFVRVSIDESFPRPLVEDVASYSYLLAPAGNEGSRRSRLLANIGFSPRGHAS